VGKEREMHEVETYDELKNLARGLHSSALMESPDGGATIVLSYDNMEDARAVFRLISAVTPLGKSKTQPQKDRRSREPWPGGM
jgi:hypothetical protein